MGNFEPEVEKALAKTVGSIPERPYWSHTDKTGGGIPLPEHWTGSSKINLAEVNKTNGRTPRVDTLKKRLIDAISSVSGERARYWTESYMQTEGEHECIRRAKGFANVLAKTDIAIRDDELIVGHPTRFIRGAHPNVEYGAPNLKAALDASKMTTSSEAQKSNLEDRDRKDLEFACEYWKDRYCNKRLLDEWMTWQNGKGPWLCQTGMTMQPPVLPTHLTPGADYDRILAEGLLGHIAAAKRELGTLQADDVEAKAFLESVIIALDGMIGHAHRYAAMAREMAGKESNPQRKAELQKIAKICEWVPANPARTLQEAMQAYWFIVVGHDIEKAISNTYIGRFDQYMLPYYEKDIKEGRLTRQEAAELLGCMFVKWDSLEPFLLIGMVGDRAHQDVGQVNYIANVTVGGITSRGLDASNELSCLLLHVCAQMKTHQPHVSVRWHRGQAPEFTKKALECARDHGGGIPAFFSDRLAIEYLIDRGVPSEDARDWAMAGCVNTAYPKTMYFDRFGTNFVNHGKLIELTLNNGVDPLKKLQIGPQTGDPLDFKTFDDLMNAYLKQVEGFFEFNESQKRHFYHYVKEDRLYFPFSSAFMHDCIKKHKDCSRGGTKYQELEAGSYCDRAITDAADCLMALKRVVYDGGTPMVEVLDALKADFVGFEPLRRKLLDAPKFGNDDDEVDGLAAFIWDWTKYKELSFRDEKGRRPTMFRQGSAWAPWAGRYSGATPNGRKSGTPFSDAAASPVQGCDVKGPTATMNSITKLDPMYLDGYLMNMRFSPGVLKTQGGMQKFEMLLGTYMDKGGFHAQFNVLDREQLLKAKEHPEQYKDLVVRLGGYSVLWVELTPEVQDEIISRTEQVL